MEEFKIEKNIPKPIRVYGKYLATIKNMSVNDSFLMSNDATARNSAHMAARRLGYKVIIRKTDSGKVRVWRIK